MTWTSDEEDRQTPPPPTLASSSSAAPLQRQNARVRGPRRPASGYQSDSGDDSMMEEDGDGDDPVKSSYNLRNYADRRKYFGRQQEEIPGYDESEDPTFDTAAFILEEMKSKESDDGYDSMDSHALDMLDVEIRDDEIDFIEDMKRDDLVSFCRGCTPSTVLETVMRLKCVEESEKAGFGVCVCGSVPTYYCTLCNMITTCKNCVRTMTCVLCGSDDTRLVAVKLDNPSTVQSYIHDIDCAEMRRKAMMLNHRLDDCNLIFDDVRDRISFLVYLHESAFGSPLSPSRGVCTICFDRSARVIYSPCGHLSACSSCHLRLVANHPCHMCRATVTRTYVHTDCYIRGVVDRSSIRFDFNSYVGIERMLDYHMPDALKRYIIARAMRAIREPIEISD